MADLGRIGGEKLLAVGVVLDLHADGNEYLIDYGLCTTGDIRELEKGMSATLTEVFDRVLTVQGTVRTSPTPRRLTGLSAPEKVLVHRLSRPASYECGDGPDDLIAATRRQLAS
ncbi:MAG: hypothetical protein HY269_07555, partial [Deltaproteobacteria bacterium]|nr:hypothetical protein [Deltaproteobacteria bacterium]